MPSQVTVTGTIGPGSAVTAMVILNVSGFSIDTLNKILTVTTADGQGPRIISITAATTLTLTVSGANYTLAIS